MLEIQVYVISNRCTVHTALCGLRSWPELRRSTESLRPWPDSDCQMAGRSFCNLTVYLNLNFTRIIRLQGHILTVFSVGADSRENLGSKGSRYMDRTDPTEVEC